MPLPARAVKQTREQVLSKLDPDPPRSQVNQRISEPRILFGPDTLENYLAKKERTETIQRERLNRSRVEMSCRPFRNELCAIMTRKIHVQRDINIIQEELRRIRNLTHWNFTNWKRDGSHSSTRKRDVKQLQDMYRLERLQKQEEMMRLTDRARELRTIIESIHRQHEVPFVEFQDGGESKKTNKSKKSKKSKSKRTTFSKWTMRNKGYFST
jgi:hypothetical protein